MAEPPRKRGMKMEPENDIPGFDLEDIYDAQIAPLMDKIIGICKEHKLPMFATFLYANDAEEGEALCTTNLMFEERPIPAVLLDLAPSVYPAKTPALRMRVTRSDGSMEETVILG